MPDKDARAAVFWDFLGLTNPRSSSDANADDNTGGIYSSVTWGLPPQQVKLILLDTRWFRDDHCIPSIATYLPLGAGMACLTRWLTAGLVPNWCTSRAPQATLLGEQQWTWLEQQLHGSEATVHIVASSIQVLTTNPAMESWGHYPHERDRLIRLLSTTRNAILLSGDVHHGEILDPLAATAAAAATPRDGSSSPAPPLSFLEITSSGLTHDCSKHIYGKMCKPLLDNFHRHRFGKVSNYYIGRNFGTLTIDWESSLNNNNNNASFEVKVHDDEGHVVLTTGTRPIVPFSSPPPEPWREADYQSVPPCMDGHLQPYAWTTLVAIVVILVSSVIMMKGRKRVN